MSYVDAYFDRDSDIIRVVERTKVKDFTQNIQLSTHFTMMILEVSTKAYMEIRLVV